MENIGLALTLALPPHAYTFGVFPLHWKYLKQVTETTCGDCGATSAAIYMRLGPLLFVVANSGHEHAS